MIFQISYKIADQSVGASENGTVILTLYCIHNIIEIENLMSVGILL